MLLGSAVAVTPAANAQTGFLCGFASITDPTVEGDVQTGEIDGGPLFAADVDNPGEETANISIRCTIQVGAQGSVHSGIDAYSAEGPTQAGVAVLPAHQFTYVAPEGAPVYLCTEAEVNGQIRYFNETEDDATRGWTTSSASLCALAISQEVDPGPVGGELDPTLCPILASLSSTFPSNGPLAAVLYIESASENPDGGDTYIAGGLFWDCPEYEV